MANLMQTKSFIIKLTHFCTYALVLLVVMGLLFRATLYWSLPVAPGESAGVGDLIELLFYFIILSLSGLVMCLAVVSACLNKHQQWSNLGLFIVGLMMPFVYYLLHPYV